jgi:hypothetical protein
MNNRVFLFAVLMFAGGILVDKLFSEAHPTASGGQIPDTATPATPKPAEERHADVETRLRDALKDKWSMRVEDAQTAFVDRLSAWHEG